MVPLCQRIEAKAVEKKYLETTSPELLFHKENKFTEMLVIMFSTKIA